MGGIEDWGRDRIGGERGIGEGVWGGRGIGKGEDWGRERIGGEMIGEGYDWGRVLGRGFGEKKDGGLGRERIWGRRRLGREDWKGRGLSEGV